MFTFKKYKTCTFLISLRHTPLSTALNHGDTLDLNYGTANYKAFKNAPSDVDISCHVSIVTSYLCTVFICTIYVHFKILLHSKIFYSSDIFLDSLV